MELLIAFIEMMATVLLYNSLFNKGKMDKVVAYSLIVLVCSILFLRFDTSNRLFAYVILHILQIISIAYVDKKDNNLVLIEMLISIAITFIIQSSIIIVLFLFTGKTKEHGYLLLILYVAIILIIIILIKCSNKLKNIDLQSHIQDNLLMSNVIINISTFFMLLKLINDNGNISNFEVIQIILLIFINIFFNISFYRSIHKTIVKNKSIEVKNAYNPLLDEIIQNIRSNEHEYKNHIGMLYSMIQVSNSVPELKERAGKYIGNIQNTNVLSNVLDIEGTIIKAVLYSKLVECDQLGINLSHEIKTSLENSTLDDTEITIIISNLLNNAIEATKNAVNKNISIDIRKLERYKIEVKNNILGLNINPNDIEAFFKKGFSSKGNGRGYGLYNVKKIVKKYKGSIYARVVEDYLVIEIYV